MPHPARDLRKCEAALVLFPKFNAFVNKTKTCWLWTAGVDKNGYGQISVPGYSPMKAHRLAWVFRHGPITAAQHVLHKCDTPRCVNPNHLFLGDQAANMRDAAVKGRLHTPRPNGQTIPASIVAMILAEPAERGVVNRLARTFGVSKAFVSLVRRGQRRHLVPLSQHPQREYGEQR